MKRLGKLVLALGASCLAALALAAPSTQELKAKGGPRVAPARDTRTIAGWTVHISQDLLKREPKETARALELLEKQLNEIVRVVPPAAVAKLRRVPLYFSPEYPGVRPRAEFHPDAGWLRENGRDPAMARGVEFTNVRIFERETKRMPNFALHELAHAYHDLVLPQGFQNPKLVAAYQRAKAAGKYDRVERWFGPDRPTTHERAYAMTNQQEFFAENTEALFSRNDFFPFTRAELKGHDPETFTLLEELWGVAADAPPSSAGGQTASPTPLEIWKDYDPDQGDFKQEIVREETKGGIYWRDSYISVYVLGEEIRVFCQYAVKAGATGAPGLLNVHGWMGTASIDRSFLDDGWAVMSFDYCGKKAGRAHYTRYPEKMDYGRMEGKVIHARLPDGRDIANPKQTSHYLWFAIQRRVLSYLLVQKEVDKSRVGAKGYSYGGTLMWNLGMDPRVKAIVAYFGIGWITYHRDHAVWMYNAPYQEPPMTPGEKLYLATVECQAHAPYITAATLWLNGSNDHHGGHERGEQTFKLFRPGVPWSFAIQARGHHNTEKLGDDAKLWLEKYVLGKDVAWPAHPRSEIVLGDGGVPELRVTPAAPEQVVEVQIYECQKTPANFARSWRDVAVVRQGNTWMAKMPVLNVDDYVFGYANIRYANNVVISSDFNAAIPAKLGRAVATDKTADGFPNFSWDHVPVYAHCCADPSFFKPEHYDFLAKHFHFVTFAAGMRENAETGMAQAAAEVKKRNPAVKVLFYFTGSGPHSNFTVLNAFCPPEGFLKPTMKKSVNPTTGKETKKETRQWDKSRRDIQEWWASVAQKAVQEYGCDGVFADGLGGDGGKEVTPEKRAAIKEGTMAMCRLAHQKMGPKGLIIFNPLHGEEGAELLPVTDGAMIDNFDRTMFHTDAAKAPGEKGLNMMSEDIEAMSKASKAGKIVLFKAWPGFHQKDTELMKRPHEELVKMARKYITFPLASFLVAAGPNCYFQYTWGWRPEYGTFDWYPEFDKPLGAPKGDAKRDGWTYRREFEHASVFVDLEKKTAKIDWR